jgi:hypothetical protein
LICARKAAEFDAARVASVARTRIWDSGTAKSAQVVRKRRSAAMTAVMVGPGMGMRTPAGEYWAS